MKSARVTFLASEGAVRHRPVICGRRGMVMKRLRLCAGSFPADNRHGDQIFRCR